MIFDNGERANDILSDYMRSTGNKLWEHDALVAMGFHCWVEEFSNLWMSNNAECPIQIDKEDVDVTLGSGMPPNSHCYWSGGLEEASDVMCMTQGDVLAVWQFNECMGRPLTKFGGTAYIVLVCAKSGPDSIYRVVVRDANGTYIEYFDTSRCEFTSSVALSTPKFLIYLKWCVANAVAHVIGRMMYEQDKIPLVL